MIQFCCLSKKGMVWFGFSVEEHRPVIHHLMQQIWETSCKTTRETSIATVYSCKAVSKTASCSDTPSELGQATPILQNISDYLLALNLQQLFTHF